MFPLPQRQQLLPLGLVPASSAHPAGLGVLGDAAAVGTPHGAFVDPLQAFFGLARTSPGPARLEAPLLGGPNPHRRRPAGTRPLVASRREDQRPCDPRDIDPLLSGQPGSRASNARNNDTSRPCRLPTSSQASCRPREQPENRSCYHLRQILQYCAMQLGIKLLILSIRLSKC